MQNKKLGFLVCLYSNTLARTESFLWRLGQRRLIILLSRRISIFRYSAMDVMQKFRERLRRSSSSDVQSICISTIPDKVVTKGNDFATSQGVIRRYSIPAKTRLGSDVKPEG